MAMIRKDRKMEAVTSAAEVAEKYNLSVSTVTKQITALGLDREGHASKDGKHRAWMLDREGASQLAEVLKLKQARPRTPQEGTGTPQTAEEASLTVEVLREALRASQESAARADEAHRSEVEDLRRQRDAADSAHLSEVADLRQEVASYKQRISEVEEQLGGCRAVIAWYQNRGFFARMRNSLPPADEFSSYGF